MHFLHITYVVTNELNGISLLMISAQIQQFLHLSIQELLILNTIFTGVLLR